MTLETCFVVIHPHSRNAALVAELKETTNNISASRRSRKEQEFTSRLEVCAMICKESTDFTASCRTNKINFDALVQYF